MVTNFCISEGPPEGEESEESRNKDRRPRENPSMVGISLGLLGPPTGPPAFPTSGRVFAQVTKAPPWGILVKINGFIIGIANKSVPEGGIRLYPQGKRYSSTGKHHSTKW